MQAAHAHLLIAALKLVSHLLTLVLPSKAGSSASLGTWPQPEQQLGQSSQQSDILGSTHLPPAIPQDR